MKFIGYINNSLHLARKFARMFVCGQHLFRKVNSFPTAKLDCELEEHDVQGQICEHVFTVKWGLLCLYP